MDLLHDLVDLAASRTPDAVALRFGDQDETYQQLRRSSISVARGLLQCGVRRGDRVAVWLPNRPEVVECLLACSRIGAIFVPLHAGLKPRQVAHVLADSEARVLITLDTMSRHLPYLLDLRRTPLDIVLVRQQSDVMHPSNVPAIDYEHLLDSPPSALSRVGIDRDIVAILYTSGSTGRAKGVMVTHLNLVSGARCVSEYLQNTRDDRILAALPLSFDYGLSQVTTAMSVGARAVLTNFSLPLQMLQQVASERITGLAGVPTMWAHLAAADWPSGAVDSLRYITSSGGALHRTLIRQLQARLPHARIFSMYGLTEAFRSTYLPPDELDERPDSIGKAVPNQEVLVLKPDGTRCGPNEVGELVHRGSFVTAGYWRQPELTAARFRPLGTHLTGVPPGEIAVWSGDLVRTDTDGYLYFVGRGDALIKTSGHRVSPGEIEEVIAEVEGVIEGVAVGVPDVVLGQRIAVAIVAAEVDMRELLERVRRHCREQLPSHMMPAELRCVPQIPRNANGKPDRAALTAMLQEATIPMQDARSLAAGGE